MSASNKELPPSSSSSDTDTNHNANANVQPHPELGSSSQMKSPGFQYQYPAGYNSNVNCSHNSNSGVLTAAATGGAFALVVASALNWLNGGEFNILSLSQMPLSSPEVSGIVLNPNHTLTNDPQRNDDNDNDVRNQLKCDDEYELTNNNHNSSGVSGNKKAENDELLSEIKALKIALNENREIQERYLRNQSIEDTKIVGGALTQQAMSRLRHNTSVPQDNLLSNDDNNQNKLEYCIEYIRKDLRNLNDSIQEKIKEKSRKPLSDEKSKDSTMEETKVFFHKELTSMSESLNKMEQLLTQENYIEITDDKTKHIIIEQNIDGDECQSSHYFDTNQEELSALKDSIIKIHLESIDASFKMLQDDNDKKALSEGSAILSMYVKNLIKYPDVPRYQKIPTGNKMFKEKVAETLVGLKDFLSVLGFEENGSTLQWRGATAIKDENRSLDDDSKLDIALKVLEHAICLLDNVKSCSD